ncbi:MAG: carboxypeptidase M32 [Spirochaetia bacterium]
MGNNQDNFAALLAIDKDINLLSSAAELLVWDLETYIPEKGVPYRSEQGALLSDLIHQKSTGPELGDLLNELSENPPDSERDRALIKEWKRRYERQSKLPGRLVRELAGTTGKAQAEWARARRDNDFESFRPTLEKIIGLKKEESQCLGYDGHPYDPLLDEYEPDTKTEFITGLFSSLRQDLVDLLDKIKGGKQIDDAVLHQPFPLDSQTKLGRIILDKIGFPEDRARLDVSEHPFTISPGPDDIRITAKYDPRFFNTGFFSILHEGGHALYELGYAENIRETILADGASLGIHESQSRFWENGIGRSRPFWKWAVTPLREVFPGAFGTADPDKIYRAVNRVEPSFIRIEADEVTYNLHIILRFNLEKALINGDLQVKDLPGAWREESASLLGITPPDDKSGVLQDIHWSAGLFGYFPTYCLGNLYSAQLREAMMKEIPDYDTLIEQGSFKAILQWLREKVHCWGRSLSPPAICRNATGSVLDASPFIQYIKTKVNEVYQA